MKQQRLFKAYGPLVAAAIFIVGLMGLLYFLPTPHRAGAASQAVTIKANGVTTNPYWVTSGTSVTISATFASAPGVLSGANGCHYVQQFSDGTAVCAFTTAGTWNLLIPPGGLFGDVLLVGGGGGGGSSGGFGGGGGGGGYWYLSNQNLGGLLWVVVGYGGSPPGYKGAAAGPGGGSQLGGAVVKGGGGGGGWLSYAVNGGSGSSGGGGEGGHCDTLNGCNWGYGGSGTSGQGTTGAGVQNMASMVSAGGGGGGAGGYPSYANGGAGRGNYIFGTGYTFSAGGGGATEGGVGNPGAYPTAGYGGNCSYNWGTGYCNGGNGAPNLGGGGGGGYGAGGTGIVAIRYYTYTNIRYTRIANTPGWELAGASTATSRSGTYTAVSDQTWWAQMLTGESPNSWQSYGLVSVNVCPSGQTANSTHTGCVSPPVTSCTFNNQTIPNGGSVTAYQSSTVYSPATCTSQTRTCTNGTLSGSYQYGSCSVQSGDCTFNGQTVTNGSSVTAWQSPNVITPATCTSQSRTCTNGTLSGSYQYAACTQSGPQPPALSAGDLTATRVRAGQDTTLTWNISSAIPSGVSCTISGNPLPANTAVTSATGSTTAGPITQPTTYTLTCSNGTNPAQDTSTTATVTLIPTYQEI